MRLRKPKYYNAGWRLLGHLPDSLFWFIWPIWRSLTESLEMKLARAEFYHAIKMNAAANGPITEAERETYNKLMELALKYERGEYTF